MMGTDVERILASMNSLKDELSTQIVALARVSDYRLTMIKHTHNVNVITSTGDPEGSDDGSHGHGDGSHSHSINTFLQGNSPTGGVGHTNQVSDQLTYPGGADDGYPGDLHSSHPHEEPGVIYEAEHPEAASSFVSPIMGMAAAFDTDVGKIQTIDDNLFTDSTSFNNGYGSPWTEIYNLKAKLAEMESYANEFPQLQWMGEKQSLLSIMNMALSYAVDAKYALLTYHDYIQRAYDNEYNNNTPTIVWDNFDSETIGQHATNYTENVHIETPNDDPF